MALELQRIDPWDGDTTEDVTYYGYANAGTQDEDPKWTIRKKTVVSGVLRYEYPYVDGTVLPETSPAIAVNDVKHIKLSGLQWSERENYLYR